MLLMLVFSESRAELGFCSGSTNLKQDKNDFQSLYIALSFLFLDTRNTLSHLTILPFHAQKYSMIEKHLHNIRQYNEKYNRFKKMYFTI